MDLSTLSDEDLKKLYADDYKGISEEARTTLNEQAAPAPATTMPGAAPTHTSGPVAPTEEPGLLSQIGTNVVGGALTAADLAQQYPKTAAVATELGLAALPSSVASKIPLVSQASQIAKYPFKIASGAVDAANAFSSSRNAQALAQLEHQIRQYGKMGQAVPEQLQQAANALRSRVIGPVPSAPVAPAPMAAPAPTAPVAPTAPAAGPLPQGMAAGEAPFRPPAQTSLLDKTTSMIRQLAANKVVGNLAKGGAGLTAALMPGNVGQNYNFPTSGPLKGSEINPATSRPWTQQELAQYRAQYGG